MEYTIPFFCLASVVRDPTMTFHISSIIVLVMMLLGTVNRTNWEWPTETVEHMDLMLTVRSESTSECGAASPILFHTYPKSCLSELIGLRDCIH